MFVNSPFSSSSNPTSAHITACIGAKRAASTLLLLFPLPAVPSPALALGTDAEEYAVLSTDSDDEQLNTRSAVTAPDGAVDNVVAGINDVDDDVAVADDVAAEENPNCAPMTLGAGVLVSFIFSTFSLIWSFSCSNATSCGVHFAMTKSDDDAGELDDENGMEGGAFFAGTKLGQTVIDRSADDDCTFTVSRDANEEEGTVEETSAAFSSSPSCWSNITSAFNVNSATPSTSIPSKTPVSALLFEV